jgi:hypothetical protein
MIFEDYAVVHRDAKALLPALISQVGDWNFIVLGSDADVTLEMSIASVTS